MKGIFRKALKVGRDCVSKTFREVGVRREAWEPLSSLPDF